MSGFTCSVCGYNHSAGELPEICPVCGVNSEKFEPNKADSNQTVKQPEENVQTSKKLEDNPKIEQPTFQETKISNDQSKVEEKPVDQKENDQTTQKPDLEQVQHPKVEVDLRNIDQEIEYRDEAFVKKILNMGQQETAIYCFKKGQKLNHHYHPDAEQTIYVLRGNAELKIEDDNKTITQGHLFVIEPKVKHSIQNNGDGELVILQVTTPAQHTTQN